MAIYDEAPKAPPRVPGPIPFDRGVFAGGGLGTAEPVSVVQGPVDVNAIHNAILQEGGGAVLPEASMPLDEAPLPDDYAPSPEALPTDPSLMGFAVPDGGPPPSNDLEASLLDGVLNGPAIAGVKNPRSPNGGF